MCAQAAVNQTEITFAPLLERLRQTFATGRTRELSWRLDQLERLHLLLVEQEKTLLEALHADSGKPEMEGYVGEISFVKEEIRYVRKRLHKWVRPERTATPLVLQPARSVIRREPYGCTMIIGAWNYPIHLTLGPLVAAISAGNCTLVKPSEIAPNSSRVLAELLPRYLDAEATVVVEGGVPETTALLALDWDLILYTGNGNVARIVMEAAAKHLTPVILELGGKSPCIVDETADLDTTARRIAWGKFYNAGQTCIAPDYVLVHETRKEALIERLRATIHSFFGEDPKRSPDYGRIINERHYHRLMGLIEADRDKVVTGGEGEEETRYIAPTILADVVPDAPVMQEEIFGPILPILPISDLDAAIRFVVARPKPLALYIFSEEEANREKVLSQTSSGAVCVNAVMYHAANPNLPFGGVGESGMGAYHGRHGFEAFSHRKAVLERSSAIDPTFLYPPYTERVKRWLKRLL